MRSPREARRIYRRERVCRGRSRSEALTVALGFRLSLSQRRRIAERGYRKAGI